jgi:hypothetical protein
MNIKKLLIVVIALFAINAYACTTKNYIVDGRVITCTICGTVITCV